MARSKALAELSDTEILGMLDQAKDEATNLRFQHVTGQLDNMKHLAGSRKQVARILTELRAREISAAEMMATVRQTDGVDASSEVGADASGPARVFKRRRRRDG